MFVGYLSPKMYENVLHMWNQNVKKDVFSDGDGFFGKQAPLLKPTRPYVYIKLHDVVLAVPCRSFGLEESYPHEYPKACHKMPETRTYSRHGKSHLLFSKALVIPADCMENVRIAQWENERLKSQAKKAEIDKSINIDTEIQLSRERLINMVELERYVKGNKKEIRDAFLDYLVEFRKNKDLSPRNPLYKDSTLRWFEQSLEPIREEIYVRATKKQLAKMSDKQKKQYFRSKRDEYGERYDEIMPKALRSLEPEATRSYNPEYEIDFDPKPHFRRGKGKPR